MRFLTVVLGLVLVVLLVGFDEALGADDDDGDAENTSVKKKSEPEGLGWKIWKKLVNFLTAERVVAISFKTADLVAKYGLSVILAVAIITVIWPLTEVLFYVGTYITKKMLHIFFPTIFSHPGKDFSIFSSFTKGLTKGLGGDPTLIGLTSAMSAQSPASRIRVKTKLSDRYDTSLEDQDVGGQISAVKNHLDENGKLSFPLPSLKKIVDRDRFDNPELQLDGRSGRQQEKLDRRHRRR